MAGGTIADIWNSQEYFSVLSFASIISDID
jgi:hypothetical protein